MILVGRGRKFLKIGMTGSFTGIIIGFPDNTDSNKTLYPFIDGKRKNINVACEVVDYTPVSIDWLLSLDIDTIIRMETVSSKSK